MTVRCAKCGEELLGAVNRCWKCGQQFIARPTIEGLPPVQPEYAASADEPIIQAQLADSATALLDATAQPANDGSAPADAMPAPIVATLVPPPLPPNPLIAQRQPSLVRPVSKVPDYASLGGAIGSVVLGLFAVPLAFFRYEAAIVALIGLVMGIWGLRSPRRGWALVGMLLCCLGIAIGAYTGARMVYIEIQRNARIGEEDILPQVEP